MDLAAFFQKDFTYAVVGATVNADKYGHRVLMDLHHAGMKVIGVNPKYKEIEGIPVFPHIQDIPQKPDVVVSVVPPEVGLGVINDAIHAGVTKLWFQPGAENDAVRAKLQETGVTAVADGRCIMVEKRQHGFDTFRHF